MKYYELEKLQRDWNGKVCLFGVGKIGSTWGFDIVDAAGFSIDFYCDNNKRNWGGRRNDILCISPEELYQYKEETLVFITCAAKYQQEISDQMQKNGITRIISIDHLYMQDIIESVLASKNEEVKKRYEKLVDDKKYIDRLFEYSLGYTMNWENPVTYNEKLQWLKIHDRKPVYTTIVDKYAVKEYVANIIGEEYIIPTLGVYDHFDEIDFDKLPDQFVLKCTHDSGGLVICNNKNSFEKESAKKKLDICLKRNFYYVTREWPYKNVKPRIIAEKYMADESGYELKDYKIFNFNGSPALIQVDFDRFSEHMRNLYSTGWEHIEGEIEYHSNPDREIAKPECLGEMLDVAEKLSANFKHIRTDFYCINNRVYFGEFTFYPGAGLEHYRPEALENELSGLLSLSDACGGYIA